MITFKQFLAEAAVGKRPEYKELEVEKAVKLLNKKCKNALWMLNENHPIWRGMGMIKEVKATGFGMVDTSATQRESENTTNYYTMILDNNPLRKGFPLRSRSFIGSTDYGRAKDYGWHGEIYALIPTDSAKIGMVNKEDMWDTNIALFGLHYTIEDWNAKWHNMGLKPTLESFKKFDAKLKAGDEHAFMTLEDEIALAKKYKNNFLDSIWKAYSTEATKHTAVNTLTMPHKSKCEVWVGGEVVVITEKMWQQLRAVITGGASKKKEKLPKPGYSTNDADWE